MCVPKGEEAVRGQDGESIPSFIQVVAFGEGGVEVHEVPLSSITERKGKGKGKGKANANPNSSSPGGMGFGFRMIDENEPIHALTDIGGDTGFLTLGGHWHRSHCGELARNDSTMSCASSASVENIPTDAMRQLRAEEGIYGWLRRGVEDWRVFWVGGTSGRVQEVDEDDGII